MSILTMSSAEVRRRAKYLNSTALWGRLGGRQFGSPEDLALSRLERDGWARLARSVQQMGRVWSEVAISAADAGRRMGEAFAAAFREPTR